MRKLVAMAFVLVLFGASMQCVADCLTVEKAPPCHQHSQSKSHSAPDTCQHIQTAADQPAALLTRISQPGNPLESSLQPSTPALAFETPHDRLLTALRI